MVKHSAFPIELYRLILEHLAHDKPTLYRAALSCQTLCLEAECVLYRNVKVSSIASKEKRFLKTVTKTPRRAALVRRYALCRHSSFVIDEDLWALLVSGLRAMASLENLTFQANSGPSAKRLQLTSCTFQLKYLHWGCYCDEEGIVALLKKQPKIRELVLPRNFGVYVDKSVRFPKDVLGELQVLTGGHAALKMILPGRPYVREVHWVTSQYDPHEFDQVTLEAIKANVKMLAFGGYSLKALPLISGYLVNLEVLGLVGLKSGDKPFSHLTHMPRLRRLMITQQRELNYDVYADHKRLAAEFFENSKSLGIIDIQANSPDDSLRWCRWYRGRELHTFIDSEVWD